MSNNICKYVALATASLSLALSIGSAFAQAAETFFVQEGVALNTNNNFSRIDGNPRMSIYRRNDNDPDQQFDRLSGNRGGTLLKHRSTGKCLNAHYLSNGSQINVWPCDANDPDQNWNLVDVGSGYSLIKRTGTNLCVDTPTRDNQGKVHLWTCDGNNGNQRWKSSATSTTVTSAWRLPWSTGVRATITQGWHVDGYGMNGIDIGLSAGTPVLAPIDSTVIKQCDAGSNHRAILLQASNGQQYSMIHVTTSNISVGKTYRRGEQIGTVAANMPWNNCAKSYAPHLHFGLPSKDFSIGGYTLSPTSIPSPMTANN
ncbi:ricin-type beta-trefoil lectin domain protein [Nostocaceae cyanobacterium CENA369]|uniref:Ricin-type beta-trefoil lectin domain protein n=1 Tax=Dendronalium phyllosphericum CENA369 TaxID=1725256 RepID=A0A8J7LBD8_9NOST|nr:ricin-type beta-trefoil lectin domain protein [Dendronalium phyllosphericum]MBH8571762.1 ricin-type beta-trefoil lectin domain protein [Dendronalium phyllosphericum CENA369]